MGLALGYSLWLGLKTSAERGTRRTKRDWAAAELDDPEAKRAETADTLFVQHIQNVAR